MHTLDNSATTTIKNRNQRSPRIGSLPSYLITAVQESETNKGYSIVTPIQGEHAMAVKEVEEEEEEHAKKI